MLLAEAVPMLQPLAGFPDYDYVNLKTFAV